jgi:hypothetical protein
MEHEHLELLQAAELFNHVIQEGSVMALMLRA